MKNNRHLLRIDALKILSIFAVILLHSAAPLLIRYNTLGGTWWWMGNIYDSLSRWCIPVFIMISGGLLIDETNEMPMRYFFKQRLKRVFIPFLLWSCIYFLWRILVNGESYPLISFPILFLKEPLYYHLWFLHLLIGLYLLAPLLGLYVRNANRKKNIYLMLLWFLFGSIVPMMESLFDVNTSFSMASLHSVFSYSGYFMVGYLFRDIRLKPVPLLLCVFLFLVSFFVTAWGTYHITVVRNNGIFQEVFYEYMSFNVLCMAFSVYMIAKNVRIPGFRVRYDRCGMLRFLAGCVPGIYFVHAMVIAVFKKGMLGITLNETMVHPGIGIPVFAFLVFIGSLLIVSIMKLIPGIRHVVP